MELLTAFPDIEDFALELLGSVAPTVLATPDTITPPLIAIRRVGGADSLIIDVPRVQVQTFGSTRAQSRDAAEACRQIILASPATGFDGVSIDHAWTETAPVWADYGDQNLQRYVATYRIALRRSR